MADGELTFEKALKVTQAMETANRDVRDLQLQPTALDSTVSKAASQVPVHNVKEKHKWPEKATPLTCHRCGGEHMARDCRFLNEKCHGCGKKGHVKKMCKSSPRDQQRFKGGGKHKQDSFRNDKKQSAHHISESPETISSDEEVFTMYNLANSKIAKVDPHYHTA